VELLRCLERHPPPIPELEWRAIPLPSRLERVYVIERAEAELGFHPHFNALEFLTTPSAVP
jgi:hypothetical protein